MPPIVQPLPARMVVKCVKASECPSACELHQQLSFLPLSGRAADQAKLCTRVADLPEALIVSHYSVIMLTLLPLGSLMGQRTGAARDVGSHHTESMFNNYKSVERSALGQAS